MPIQSIVAFCPGQSLGNIGFGAQSVQFASMPLKRECVQRARARVCEGVRAPPEQLTPMEPLAPLTSLLLHMK